MKSSSMIRMILESLVLSHPGLSNAYMNLLIARSRFRRLPVLDEANLTLSDDRCIWVIDKSAPQTNSDSGANRLLEIMTLAEDMGLKVIFSSVDGTSLNLPSRRVLGSAITQLTISEAASRFKTDPPQRLHIWLCRFSVAKKYLELAAGVPGAKVIFDTVDLHGLRLERLGLSVGNALIALLGRKILKDEILLSRKAHETVVVSIFEQEILAKYKVLATVLSNIHPRKKNNIQWSERQGQVFVGNFKHTPNVTGIKWYLEKVWCHLPTEIQNQGLVIVGSPKPKVSASLRKQGVTSVGKVLDLAGVVQGARISIAPLTSGAGVKGKIGESMAFGVPVVTTTLGAEGMGLEWGQDILVADDPIEFAEAVCDLVSGEGRNLRMAANGRQAMARAFSRESAERVLRRLLVE